jgi:type IV pilus assembly protein PilM
VEEVRGSIDYYLAQPAAVPIRRCVISGGGSRLNGLEQRLASATRLPVSPAVAGRLTAGSGQDFDEVQSLMTVPVGLALVGVA